MSRSYKRICQLGWPILAILVLTACSDGPQNGEGLTTLERIQRDGVVRLGYANEAPYAYLDQMTGRLTGEAPEIARTILQRMGFKRVEGVLTEWGALIPGLKAGRFDIIAAGMYITPQRCREIAFTNPTYSIGEAFLVKAGNPLGLHGYGDVAARPAVRLGVVVGTVELGYAKGMGIPRARITLLPDNPSALAAMSVGRIDAFGATRLTLNDLLAKAGPDAGLALAHPFRQPVIDGREVRGYGAFGVRKEDRALLEALNRQLKTFIGSPEHQRLVAPFGFTSSELPGQVTAAALCQPRPAAGMASPG